MKSMRGFAMLLSCAVTFACNRPAEAKKDDTPPAPSSTAPKKSPRGFHYATASTGEAFEEKTSVYMDMSGIRIGKDGPLLVPLDSDGAQGFGADQKVRGTLGDLELRALGAALAKVDKTTPAVLTVHVDARATYRMVTELMFTGGQSGFARFDYVVVDADDRLRAVPLTAPKAGKIGTGTSSAAAAKKLSDELDALELKALASLGSSASKPKRSATASASAPPLPTLPPPTLACGSGPLALTVIVVVDGYFVKAMGGSVPTGCPAAAATTGGGPTLPRIAGRLDTAGLRACAARLHDCDASYAADSTVRVTMNPSFDFQSLVSTWDAVRARDDGKPLMGDVVLTVLK